MHIHVASQSVRVVGAFLLVGNVESSHFIHAQIELLITDANTQGQGGRGEGRRGGGAGGGHWVLFMVAT